MKSCATRHTPKSKPAKTATPARAAKQPAAPTPASSTKKPTLAESKSKAYSPGSLVHLVEEFNPAEHVTRERFRIDTPNILEGATVTDDAIENVVVLTETSRNKRNYKNVLKQAAKVFEGATVYLDHKPYKDRSVEQMGGKLEGLSVVGNKVIAKKLIPIGNKADVLRKTVKTAADRVGLSIEADGAGTVDDNGILVVSEIKAFPEGRPTVALVHSPGATTNLHESDSSIGEGVIADKVELDERLEKVRKITCVVSDLVYSIIWDRNAIYPTAASKVAALIAIYDDAKSELKKLTSTVAEEGQTGDPATLQEIANMDVKEIKSLDELKTARPDLFKEEEETETPPAAEPKKEAATTEGKTLAEQLAAEKARADAAEKKLTEAAAAAEKAKTVKPIVEKVLAEMKVPARLQTARFLRELAAAETEPAMREIVEDRMRWLESASDASPYTGHPTVIRESAPINEGTSGNSDTKLPSERVKIEELGKVFSGGRL